jgi:hypothetical protein
VVVEVAIVVVVGNGGSGWSGGSGGGVVVVVVVVVVVAVAVVAAVLGLFELECWVVVVEAPLTRTPTDEDGGMGNPPGIVG